jgi:hypothetical protein
MPNMVTTSGGTISGVIRQFDDAWALTIYSPATLTSTSVTIEVEPTDTGTSFVTLQSGGSDVVMVAGRATVISPVPFMQMRVACGAAEGADRTFRVTKTILT